MRLSELAEEIDCRVLYGGETEITGLCVRAELAKEGDLFFALIGKCDGGEYASQAASRGASAVVTERPLSCSLPQLVTKDARLALAKLSAAFYGHPEQNLEIVTVTGTNGKTSVTTLLGQLLELGMIPTATIGTLGAFFRGQELSCGLTTPDPPELYRLLRLMVNLGAKVVVMEASAHAIYWKKLEGIQARVGIFTNLSQDHLDFFGDMEHYADVKRGYFMPRNCEYALLNADDPQSDRIIQESDCEILTYGRAIPADVFCYREQDTPNGCTLSINLFDREFRTECRLHGVFNRYNLLAAVGAASVLGVTDDAIVRAVPMLTPPDGRCKVIRAENGSQIVIDYAHTPDGVANILTACREMADGHKVIAVFGCGGDRDTSKRAQMGRTASALADFCVVTSDNPRSEDPFEIMRQIEVGLKKGDSSYVLIENRRKATAYAIELAAAGDIVALLGKGAERYQEIFGVKYTYRDEDVVSELLREGT